MSPDFGRTAEAPELWRAQLRFLKSLTGSDMISQWIFDRQCSRCRQTSGELPTLLNSGEPSYVARAPATSATTTQTFD